MSLKRWLGLLVFAWTASGASELGAQMMGGGREVRAGREVMNERLASSSDGQRAWLETVREGRAGFRAVSQRLTLRAGIRSYALGSMDVSESLALTTYSLRTPRLKLRVAGGPLRFTSGDSVSVAGVSPFDARLDLALGARDSLRIGLRVPSSPVTLTGAQVAALASIGTATVDFASVELGTPANVAAGYSRSLPLGGSGSLSGGVGIDYEPRPSTSGWSYWRGATLRAGLRASRGAGSSRLTAGVDVTRSFSDSLGGRNLFPGGGTLLVRAGVASYLGPGSGGVLDLGAFYFRPFDAGRTDAANRRIPTGDFVGASAIGVWPVRDLLVVPAVVASRESSRGTAGSTAAHSAGWAVAASVGVDVPIGSRFGLTPELGYAKGSLRSDLGPDGAGGPLATRDPLSGWWFATDLSFSF